MKPYGAAWVTESRRRGDADDGIHAGSFFCRRLGAGAQVGTLTVTPASRCDIQRSKTAMVARLALRLAAPPHLNWGGGWLRSDLGDRPDDHALNSVRLSGQQQQTEWLAPQTSGEIILYHETIHWPLFANTGVADLTGAHYFDVLKDITAALRWKYRRGAHSQRRSTQGRGHNLVFELPKSFAASLKHKLSAISEKSTQFERVRRLLWFL
jgi:hypothetical protein